MRLTVREVALAKGIKNATQLGELAEIPLASIYRIWNNTARMIGLDTLDKLCTVLDVPVGMLLTHVKDSDIAARSEAPQTATPSKSGKRKTTKDKLSKAAPAHVASVGA